LLASLGGFLAPVVLSAETSAAIPLFGYLALLDAGLLAAAYLRRWSALPVVGFLCTQALYLGWFNTVYRPSQLWVALGAATVFFVLFALAAPVEALADERRGRPAGFPRMPVLLLVLRVPLAYAL